MKEQALASTIPKFVFRAATALRGEGSWHKYLRELRRIELEQPERSIARQREKLSRLISFATLHVPHYRDISGRTAFRPSSAADNLLSEFPLLEKRVLQKTPERLHGDLKARTTAKSTGGSTGEPVMLVKTADGVAIERAVTWLGLGWFGIEPGDRAVRFWGTPLTASRRLRFKLADLAMNRIRLSAFELDDADLAGYYDRIRRFQPAWFYGYATLIDLMAQWIEESGRDGRVLGLRSIVPTSEPLTPEQRSRIERVYGAPVQNEYGCGEVGAIAYECEEGLLHVMTDSVLVEVLKDDGTPAEAGEIGEVVVTDLNNYAMPLIRYRMGDRAIRGGECTCGRVYPTLEKVVGRIHDVVYTPLGRRWHGEKVDYLMSSIHQELFAFQRYQVVQTEKDVLEVRLVAAEPIPPEVEARVAVYVRERLDGMRVVVKQVAAVERSASGKLRLVKNEVGEHLAAKGS